MRVIHFTFPFKKPFWSKRNVSSDLKFIYFQFFPTPGLPGLCFVTGFFCLFVFKALNRVFQGNFFSSQTKKSISFTAVGVNVLTSDFNASLVYRGINTKKPKQNKTKSKTTKIFKKPNPQAFCETIWFKSSISIIR